MMSNSISYRIDDLYKKVKVTPNQGKVNKTLNTGTLRNTLANTLNVPKKDNKLISSFSNKNSYAKFF